MTDKSKLGEGQWQHEPDRLEWIDPTTGYPGLIIRHPELGHLCGYVGVLKGHPSYGREYDDVDVNVHGGLTYAGPNGDKIGWARFPEAYWLGFDCAHAGDLIPYINATCSEGYRKVAEQDTYRDVFYVQSECESLAKQLAAINAEAGIIEDVQEAASQ